MKLKSLLIAGAVAAAFMAPEYAMAHPKPRPPKSDLSDKKNDAKEGLREQLKNLRKDWFEGMKGNREEVRERIKEIREEFKNKRDDVIDANEEDGDKPGE